MKRMKLAEYSAAIDNYMMNAKRKNMKEILQQR